MLEFQGQYATCKVMTDNIEPVAVQQIYAFLNSPAFEGAKIRIMPDVHAGAGCVVGFTATLTDRVIPNVVGVDIGCGVYSICLGRRDHIDFAALDAFIRKQIPSGFAVRDSAVILPADLRETIVGVCAKTAQDESRVLKSIGSLGGGNHFIELGEDELGHAWVTVHSGSRNFGLKVANHHQRKAVKTAGRGHGLEWLEGSERDEYLEHMQVAQRLAHFNRWTMIDVICEGFFRVDPLNQVKALSVHNYISMGDMMIRKGAISAQPGEPVVIPWNMRDGLIIGRGKGNADWNVSAPHGAGRVMGRGQAKRTLKVEDFQASMDGIWTSCVGAETIDESPMVYKPADEIRAAIEDTVEIVHTVKPIYNFKAS